MEVAALDECVYVWRTPDGRDLRFGTSAGPVGVRLRQYAKHLTASLNGLSSPSPLWEAESWRALLIDHGRLNAFAHQPISIETVAGPLRPFLDIERRLIKLNRPPLNRSHR